MIKWRDVRSSGDLEEFLAGFRSMTPNQQKTIKKEQWEFLADFRKRTTIHDAEIAQVLTKPLRKRRRRR